MKTRTVIASLRELIAVLEAGNVDVLRFAAAGDCEDVVIALRVAALGDELVTAINNPQATARQRLLALASPQTPLALETGDAAC